MQCTPRKKARFTPIKKSENPQSQHFQKIILTHNQHHFIQSKTQKAQTQPEKTQTKHFPYGKKNSKTNSGIANHLAHTPHRENRKKVPKNLIQNSVRRTGFAKAFALALVLLYKLHNPLQEVLFCISRFFFFSGRPCPGFLPFLSCFGLGPRKWTLTISWVPFFSYLAPQVGFEGSRLVLVHTCANLVVEDCFD